ncbi:general secretion pathway protein GspG [Rhodomicrobium udaipurense JA643]|nr:general secretion pathway protein GspG [Rhodomicrobium udaipurense JA643]
MRSDSKASARRQGSPGSSLMEMVVVLAILSLLAALAAPHARMNLKRDKEIQLRETLRTVRAALDRFHADMMKRKEKDPKGGASPNGYPYTVQTLVDGSEKAANGPKKRYLRSLPVNPFAPAGTPFQAQWTFVSYQRGDAGITSSSYGTTLAEVQTVSGDKDIYDLHAKTDGIALDGSRYADW